jgi:TolB protein
MSCSERVERPGPPLKAGLPGAILTLALLAASAPAAEPLRLTRDGSRKMGPVFADGGASLVFAAHERPNLVALVRLGWRDGSRSRVLPEVSAHQLDPAYSPGGGRRLAYARTATSPQSELVILDTREHREAVFRPRDSRATARHPSFSPDGKTVAFTLNDHGGQQVATVGLDGKDPRVLAPSAGINGWPAFAPDGSAVAFASSRDGDLEIYTVSPDGSNLRRLTRSPGRDLDPAWSPDGRRIAFTSARDGNEEVYVMGADGSNPRNLTRHPDRDADPAWHPDGRHLAFVSERGGGSDLYWVDAGGGS